MANHQKPTKEELQAGMNQTLETLKTLPTEEKPVTPPEPPVVEPETKPVTPDEPVAPADDKTVVTPPVKSEEKPAPTQDWEKRFRDSSRESQILGFKQKEIDKAIEEADALPEPSDDEMKAKYENWDELDQVTKDLAKDRITNAKRNELIKGARAKFKNVVDWEEKIGTFVTDPAVLASHPELEGKTEEFRAFATKDTRRGVDIDVLILAFNGEQAKNVPAPKKGQMFESGSHGATTPTKPVDDKLSPAEGAALRDTDYKKYKEYLKAGKIRMSE